MVVFPNCKINLGLHITGKRTDGYHELETVFYPIQLCDSLELISANNTSGHHKEDLLPIEFSSTGLNIPGDTTNNLCVKAYQLLKANFPQLPSVKIHLHKVIPMGAGLGGGSADGAFALKLINEKYQLNISETQLINYAAQLGSDCAFFILNKPSYALGRGEKLMPFALDLSAYQFVLAHPGVHISTKWAFEQIKPAKPSLPLTELLSKPIETWKDSLHNDFEAPILATYPEMNQIKNALYEDGAIYASMSGSGSSFFGIYPKQHKIEIKKQFQFRIDIIE